MEREPVTAPRLRAFLEALGREFPHPARLYLSGGESLVWRGLRAATRDVDVSFRVDPRWHGEWLRALRDLIRSTNTSVEEAGPEDFIPLPPGAEDRAQFAGRFGQVDVFLFDPYSIALSKLARAHAQDLDDVRVLLSHGLLTPADLHRHFDVVLAAAEAQRLNVDPERMRWALEQVVPPQRHAPPPPR